MRDLKQMKYRGCLMLLLALGSSCGEDGEAVCKAAAECASELVLDEVNQDFVDGYVKTCLEDYDCMNTCQAAIGGYCVQDWIESQGYESCKDFCGS